MLIYQWHSHVFIFHLPSSHYFLKWRLFDGHLWMFTFIPSILATLENIFLGIPRSSISAKQALRVRLFSTRILWHGGKYLHSLIFWYSVQQIVSLKRQLSELHFSQQRGNLKSYGWCPKVVLGSFTEKWRKMVYLFMKACMFE